MNELDMWNIVIGFAMPLLVALVNQWRWPATVKGLVAFAVCAIAAAVTVYVRDGWDGQTWLRTLMVIFLTAVATYRLWWQPSQIAPRIEQATSVSGPGPQHAAPS